MPTSDDKRITEGEDNRQDERFSLQAPVIFSHFGSKFHREYTVMTFNLSKNGLCLEVAEAIKPGATIYLRKGITPADEGYAANWNHLRTASLGEVRWCRELADKSGTYCVGVKYY